MEIEVGPYTLSGVPGGPVTVHAKARGSYERASLFVEPGEVIQLGVALRAFEAPRGIVNPEPGEVDERTLAFVCPLCKRRFGTVRFFTEHFEQRCERRASLPTSSATAPREEPHGVAMAASAVSGEYVCNCGKSFWTKTEHAKHAKAARK